MRNVKFRGKKISDKKWTEGYLFPTFDEQIGIGPKSAYCSAVVPETVGQFTGLLADKRKTNLEPEIYEGDIFRSQDDDTGIRYHVVMWIEQRAAFYMVPIGHYGVMTNEDVSKDKEFDWLFQEAALYDFYIDCGLTKVGNVHDNPELLNA